MVDETYHYCEADVWSTMPENPRHQVEGQAIFELKFQVTKVRKKTIDYYHNDEPLPICVLPDECEPMVEKIFRVRKNVLLRDNSANCRDDNGFLTNNLSILSIILSTLDVPINHQDNIIYEIHSMATFMMQNPSYAGQAILAMMVQVSVVTYTRNIVRIAILHSDDVNIIPSEGLDTGDVARDAIRESFEDQPTENLYRATASSIEALERIIIEEGVEDLESIGDCVICMDKFLLGMEVRKMPCLHIFHRNCIKEWLERSHLCPLCRFAMPYQLQR